MRPKKLVVTYSRGCNKQNSTHSQEAQFRNSMISPKGDSTIFAVDSHEGSKEEADIQDIVQHIEERVNSEKRSGGHS